MMTRKEKNNFDIFRFFVVYLNEQYIQEHNLYINEGDAQYTQIYICMY